MNNFNLPYSQLQPVFAANNVAYAAVFGSRAKGNADKTSDVDILINFQHGKTPSYFKFFDFENEVKQIIKKDVDLLTVDELSPYMKDEVLQTMKIFYDTR